MNELNIAQFVAQFPLLSATSGYSDILVDTWWETADVYITESWRLQGKIYQQARLLMTAHLVHLALTPSDNGGVVQSASEGSVSVSYVMPNTRNGWQFWLAKSPYGQQLWALLNIQSTGGAYIGGLPEREAVRKVGGVFL